MVPELHAKTHKEARSQQVRKSEQKPRDLIESFSCGINGVREMNAG